MMPFVFYLDDAYLVGYWLVGWFKHPAFFSFTLHTSIVFHLNNTNFQCVCFNKLLLNECMHMFSIKTGRYHLFFSLN